MKEWREDAKQRRKKFPVVRPQVDTTNWMLMIDDVVCEYGPPEYRTTEDGEAWYWCFRGHELPVADNLSELLVAGSQLMARAYVEKQSRDCK